MQIWAKIYVDEKIVNHSLYDVEGKFSLENFEEYLTDICANFDIPRPITLSKHTRHFNEFNICIYTPADFVESVNFDRFTLEAVSDEDEDEHRSF